MFMVVGFIAVQAVSSYAQKSRIDYFEKAEEAYYKRDYFLAGRYYEYFLGFKTSNEKTVKGSAYITKLTKQIGNVSTQEIALYRLTESYYKLPNYNLAEFYGEKAVNLSVKQFPLTRYWYASALKSNGKFSEAEQQFKQFIKAHTVKDRYVRKAEQEMNSLVFIEEQKSKGKDSSMTIENIIVPAEGVYALRPVQSDERFLFTATTKTKLEKQGYETRIYQGRLKNNQLLDVGLFPEKQDEEQVRYGEGVLSTDGNCFFYTQATGIQGQGKSDIYYSIKDNGAWTKPALVEGGINMSEYSAKQPMITPDGKYLLFSSDRPGGFGGFDIWFSTIDSNNKVIGKPQNAGKNINTVEDENSPFYHQESKTLFFSSNGKKGMGGFDIYGSYGDVGKWGESFNLGEPFNSVRDDLYFYANPYKDFAKEAFLSSDRYTDCCLQVYKLTREIPRLPIDRKDEIVQPIAKKQDSLVIYFDFDSSILTAESESHLRSLAQDQLKETSLIKISGFTDGKGTLLYNQKLALRRIVSCLQILKEQGIQDSRLITYVGASCCPVQEEILGDGTDNSEARQQNRRVAVEVLK